MSCCNCCCLAVNGECCGPPGSKTCCKEPRVCCGSGEEQLCCPEGDYCCKEQICCSEGRECCGTQEEPACCLEEEECCFEVLCCFDGRCCGTEEDPYCCEEGECCIAGVCAPCCEGACNEETPCGEGCFCCDGECQSEPCDCPGLIQGNTDYDFELVSCPQGQTAAGCHPNFPEVLECYCCPEGYTPRDAELYPGECCCTGENCDDPP